MATNVGMGFIGEDDLNKDDVIEPKHYSRALGGNIITPEKLKKQPKLYILYHCTTNSEVTKWLIEFNTLAKTDTNCPPFEIVQISSSSDAQLDTQTPWSKLDVNDTDFEKKILSKYPLLNPGPALVVVDGEDGHILTSDGTAVEKLYNRPAPVFEAWLSREPGKAIQSLISTGETGIKFSVEREVRKNTGLDPMGMSVGGPVGVGGGNGHADGLKKASTEYEELVRLAKEMEARERAACEEMDRIEAEKLAKQLQEEDELGELVNNFVLEDDVKEAKKKKTEVEEMEDIEKIVKEIEAKEARQAAQQAQKLAKRWDRKEMKKGRPGQMQLATEMSLFSGQQQALAEAKEKAEIEALAQDIHHRDQAEEAATAATNNSLVVTALVLHEYTPEPEHESDHLSLVVGAHVCVVDKANDDWYYGHNFQGGYGLFPTAYVGAPALHAARDIVNDIISQEEEETGEETGGTHGGLEKGETKHQDRNIEGLTENKVKEPTEKKGKKDDVLGEQKENDLLQEQLQNVPGEQKEDKEYDVSEQSQQENEFLLQKYQKAVDVELLGGYPGNEHLTEVDLESEDEDDELFT